MRLSANLGFLWTELPLPDGIRAAARAGFDAVECHFPYDVPPADVRAALDETGLPMVSLNTAPGPGGRGMAALVDHVPEARAAIAQAVGYAQAVGAGRVHVMAGCASGPEAMACFAENLTHAADLAATAGVGLLIEPLNAIDVPGYAIGDIDAAAAVVRAVNRPELGLMLDLYHILKSGGDPVAAFRRHRDKIGHVQFATPPGRIRPSPEILSLLKAIAAEGWRGPVGAEYRPEGRTEDSLGWMSEFGA